MRIKNDQAGLTLVELLVTIVVASIVTLSACTMLLFGLRINKQSTKTSMGQNTVQVLMEALEDVAAEAKDLIVESDADSWAIKDGTQTLFSYESAHQTIYTGMAPTQEYEVGIPFLKGIFASSVTYEDQLLTIDVQITEEDNYSTSIYCRMGPETVEKLDTTGEDFIIRLNGAEANDHIVSESIPNYISRDNFLKVLAAEYGSRGEIKEQITGQVYAYYSGWYLSDDDYSENPSWNKNTPWCACYLSWAMEKTKGRFASAVPRQANVEKLLNEIKSSANGHTWNSVEESSTVYPGDLIFFNFDEDAESDHVGVVLTFADNYIYTIEGNTAGKVAVRKYAADDPRIMGYGVLSWK